AFDDPPTVPPSAPSGPDAVPVSARVEDDADPGEEPTGEPEEEQSPEARLAAARAAPDATTRYRLLGELVTDDGSEHLDLSAEEHLEAAVPLSIERENIPPHVLVRLAASLDDLVDVLDARRAAAFGAFMLHKDDASPDPVLEVLPLLCPPVSGVLD